MIDFTLDIRFTDRAGQLLPPGQTSLRLPGLAPDVRMSLQVGDRLRIDSIANCPWFAVTQRFWSIGEATTLTIWLDEAED